MAKKTKSTKRAKTTKRSAGAKSTPAAVRRGRGLSIHLGLNSVSPAHYEGWSGELQACEADARDMTAIARAAGMTPTTLLTTNATRAKTLAALRAAAKQLKAGDLLFLTYSGHGGQIPDVSGEETDKLDETWCLFDGELIDDELYLELTQFAEGVRILVLSDSCHSGTVTRARPTTPPVGRSKMMPPSVAMRTYNKHQKFYDDLQKAVEREARATPSMDPDAMLAAAHANVSNRLTTIAATAKAAVILISGCQDNQTSMDGDHNGAFTEQLLHIWNNGKFKGNYAQFHAAVKAGMLPTQTPNLFTLGSTAGFAAQLPFTV